MCWYMLIEKIIDKEVKIIHACEYKVIPLTMILVSSQQLLVA